jgi:endonuclease I
VRRLASLLALALLAAPPALAPSPACADVFLSELCDPQLNYLTDRFVEIYNSGASPVDLTGWSVVAVGNGADIFTWNLSGSIAPGDALVLGDATTVDTFDVDFADEAWSSSNSTWNGKVGDGARLIDESATVLDNVVVDGTRFENKDYFRKDTIGAPNPVYDANEWIANAVGLASQGTPGSHNADPPIPAPVISSVTIDPSAPLAGETVNAQAIVIDDQATITSVTLAWGFSAGALGNVIPMSVLFGNVYGTDTPIPGQAEGTTVHYRVSAANDAPASGESAIHSYTTPETVTIAQIQGMGASSPYAGQPVVTHGVVAGILGNFAVLQDGSGAWSGLWVGGAGAMSMADSVVVQGTVTETFGLGFDGTTVLAYPVTLGSTPGATVPTATPLATTAASAEAYEGVTIQITGAACTDADLGDAWEADDGSGPVLVGELAHDPFAVLGTVYDVTGIAMQSDLQYRLQPRSGADVLFVADTAAPSIHRVVATDSVTAIVTFSEDVETTSAADAANYGIGGLAVSAAVPSVDPRQVTLTVSPMSEITYLLTVTGVEDLFGNAASGAAGSFDYVHFGPPAGYYATAEGLTGDALRLALHQIIDGHSAQSYDFAWTAFATTDDKPNGKVWDIYSDVPGGTPPYEYTFGVDEGGTGGAEGNGYTREHSWPRSWFGGEVAPMNSDLFALYPCDAHVNGNRGSYPYGEVASPTWTSLNGSRRGNCSSPGYSGIVFEPIDAFKGDIARSYFYMATRYYTEDAAWPGSDMTDGADLLPWAVDLLLAWHDADPVSAKEYGRNGTIFGFQLNRNPFVDHPEWAELVFTPAVGAPVPGDFRPWLAAAAPNPFRAATSIDFGLARTGRVRIDVFDVTGRLVRTLVDDEFPAGRHRAVWSGTDSAGGGVASGVYFYSLWADGLDATRKVLRLR